MVLCKEKEHFLSKTYASLQACLMDLLHYKMLWALGFCSILEYLETHSKSVPLLGEA